MHIFDIIVSNLFLRRNDMHKKKKIIHVFWWHYRSLHPSYHLSHFAIEEVECRQKAVTAIKELVQYLVLWNRIYCMMQLIICINFINYMQFHSSAIHGFRHIHQADLDGMHDLKICKHVEWNDKDISTSHNHQKLPHDSDRNTTKEKNAQVSQFLE